MSYENVKLWFAKDSNDNIITVDEINEDNKTNTYFCPVCGSDLKPKAIKSKQITSHFAHVDASKCNSESQIHFWFKHKFLEKGDEFTVAADKVREYICKDILVEEPYETEYGIYKPDVTIFTECGSTIYFEMAFSNKKKVKDYLDMWLELKNIVVEVDIKQLMFKEKIPTFKALFYDGKCFNTKKNDTYYNAIGKYKEEKFKGNVDNELKDRIRKLDWFWEDVFRYKKGEVDIEHMVSLIDSIECEEKEIVFGILSRKSCNEIYKDYLNYKQDYVFKILQNQFNLSNENYSITKSGFEKSWCDKYLTKKIEFRNILENTYSSLDIRKYSSNEIIEDIKNDIWSIEKLIQHKRSLEFAKTNEVLKKAINDIDSKYKETNKNYHFYDSFVYDEYVSLCYNGNTLIDFKLPIEIIYSDDYIKINNFLEAEIEKYMITVEPFANLKLIEDTLNKIELKYNNVIIDKEIITYNEKIGKKRYKAVRKTKDVKVNVSHKLIAEDIILIDIERNFTNSYIHKCIFLYKNKLYTYISDYKLLERIKNGELQPVKILNMLNKLESYIIELINEQIRNDLKRYCVECENSIDLAIGEIDFFINKGFLLPKRCKSCRDKKKLIKQ